VKILVRERSLGPSDVRMRSAAAALALRGHQVSWSGLAGTPGAAGMPGEVRGVPGGLALSRVHADVVVGGSGAPRSTALAGWRARAHCMVIGIDPASLERWNALDRWAWDSLYAVGLIEERDAAALERDSLGLDRERLALWSSSSATAVPAVAHPDTDILERACERALARHRGRSPRAAVFLDRDGTLVVERGYNSDPAEIELLPGVPRALQNLRAAGYALVVVSNQSGVGRGLFPQERVHQAMAELRRQLRGHGVELDAIYFCPHRPEEDCVCRKPLPGLLRLAAEDLVLDLPRSVMIGDKRIDVATGQAAGARGVLVRTGYGHDEEARLAESGSAPSDHVAADLTGAAAWVLARDGSAEG
jgi:D-glycero-D-manno-heptose 1,7-bisphosphate phosphatase